MNQNEKAERFQALHIPGQPLMLFNIWDAGSAKTVAAIGVNAIATGSWSVANALGFADGEKTPLDLVIENLARIVQVVDLPVTIDLESGYGAVPEEVERTVTRSIQAGAIGCNLEDSFPSNGELRSVVEQAKRIESARKSADSAKLAYFINARTDVFFQASVSKDNPRMMTEVLKRAQAYADAGASGMFVPGLADEELIAQLVAGSPLPINIMVDAKTPPLATLTQLGVARVSQGPNPYLLAMNALQEAARNFKSLAVRITSTPVSSHDRKQVESSEGSAT
jgi:2-methylisocitrate lyase-like PEP mutase family enzyme